MRYKYTKLMAALVTGILVSGSAFAGPIIPIENVLSRNDDSWVGPVSLGFDINFLGGNYGQLFVNNNGNVTFGRGFGSYSYSGLTNYYNSGASAIIAPFFSDIDTRYAGSPVTYGTTTFGGRSAFATNWVDVDYYPGSTSHTLRNSFQLLIVDRSDIAAGDFDFIFNYDTIQWNNNHQTSFGPSFAGYGSGGHLYGFQTDTNDPLLTINSGQLPYNSLNSSEDGRYVFEVRGGIVAPPLPAVPEPETYVMLLVGLGLITQIARRRSGR